MMSYLAYDATNDARVESMRNHNRRANLYRKHEDLRKQCEKQIKGFERDQRMFDAECRRYKIKIQDRLNRLLARSRFGNNTRRGELKYSYNQLESEKIVSTPNIKPKPETQEKLLFRILHRSGTELYLSREEVDALPLHVLKDSFGGCSAREVTQAEHDSNVPSTPTKFITIVDSQRELRRKWTI